MVSKNSNILFVGERGYNSWSQNILREIQKQGYYCEFLDPSEILRLVTSRDRNDYTVYKKPISLRDILKLFPEGMDYVFYSQTWLRLVNDTHVPVIYWHHEPHLPPGVMNPTYLLTNHYSALNILLDNWPWWYAQIKRKLHVGFAANPAEFDNNPAKEYMGINHISAFDGTDSERRGEFWNAFMMDLYHNWKTFACNGYVRTLGGEIVSYENYKVFMEKSEALLSFGTIGIILSRRIMEMGIAHTIPVIHVPSRKAEKYMNSIGLRHMKTCMLYRDVEDLKNISEQLADPNFDRDKMTERLYNIVLNNFTYEIKVKQIMSIIK